MASSPVYRALLLLLAVCACDSADKSAPAGAAPAPSTNSSALEVSRPKAGEGRTYQFELKSSAHTGSNLITEFTLRGQLKLEAVEAKGESTLLMASLVEPRFSTTLADKAGFSKFESELTEPYFFELTAAGALSAFRLAALPSDLSAGILQTLAAAFQLPAKVASSGSTIKEYDASGTYEARYEPLGPRQLRKSKLRYAALSLAKAPGSRAQPATGLLPSIIESKGQVELGDAGLPTLISLDEKTRSGQGAMVPIDAATVLTLRSLGPAGPTPPAEWRPRLQQSLRFAAGEPLRAVQDTSERDKAKIDGRSLTQVLDELAKLKPPAESAGKSERESYDRKRGDLFGALEALVRQDEAVIPALVSRVKRREALATVALDALGSSGSAAGLKALTELLREGKLDKEQRQRVSIALSRTPRPNQDSVAALMAMLDDRDLRTQAMYGLGTSIRHLREAGKDQQADELLGVILGDLDERKGEVSVVTALRAVANSGHEGAFERTQPFLTSTNDTIRAAAVEAMQLMRRDEVDGLLAHYLIKDSAQQVRKAAVRAILVRERTQVLEAAVLSAAQDKDPHVRMAVLRVLASWQQSPALRKALENIAENDAEQKIRAEARAQLR